MASSKYFISADSRKSVSKFSDLTWFLLFEDSYNKEGSLQANRTSKKHRQNKLKVKLETVIPYLPKKKKKAAIN